MPRSLRAVEENARAAARSSLSVPSRHRSNKSPDGATGAALGRRFSGEADQLTKLRQARVVRRLERELDQVMLRLGVGAVRVREDDEVVARVDVGRIELERAE